jgi:AraC family transcriptional regulator
MLLHIKNIVCDRCILVVRQQLEQAGFQVTDIDLGTASINPEPTVKQLQNLKSSLNTLGFDLLDDEKTRFVERIKNIVIEVVHHSDMLEQHIHIPELLSDRLFKEYSYISRVFSEQEGLTLEKFIIQQKIERAKALLQEDELNLNEIAWKLGYSSSSHLSSQFKAVTGHSPRAFKLSDDKQRKALDKI